MGGHPTEVASSVLGMGNSETAVTTITSLMRDNERSYAWLSRHTGIPYKRILAEVKHKTRPMTLDVALRAATVLGADLSALVSMTNSVGQDDSVRGGAAAMHRAKGEAA